MERLSFSLSHLRNIGTGEEFTGISGIKRLTCPQCFFSNPAFDELLLIVLQEFLHMMANVIERRT
jgi:hypothetical protein